MPRALKPYKVDEYRNNKKGVIVELFFDRDSKEFFATYAGKQLRKPSINELRAAMHAQVEATVKLVWIPMITIDRITPFGNSNGAFVGFDIERQWIAQTLPGFWVSLLWETYERTDKDTFIKQFYPAQAVRSAFKLPCHAEDCFYLPYSEQLWKGLSEINEAILKLRDGLNKLLTTEDGLRRIETISIRKLLEGK